VWICKNNFRSTDVVGYNGRILLDSNHVQEMWIKYTEGLVNDENVIM